MENKSKTWIIVVVVCAILFLPIIIDYIGNSKVKKITYDKYLDIVENKENALVYVGDLSQETYDDTVDLLKEVIDGATETDYASEYTVYSIDSTELTSAESANIGTNNGYVFIISGDQQKVLTTSATKDYLIDLVDAYYNANFTSSNTSFKVAKDAAAFEKLVDSKAVTVAVFGRDTCYYCNIFKPVYNAVAEKYDIDIYYFNSDSYDNNEYQKVLKLGLKIPAQCNSTGEESLLSDGFGTPLTLITKKGKTIDCISGYVDRDTLIAKLVENNLIEE